MTTPAAPADRRIAQLDRLRGIAILGIFFMNVPFMANSAHAYLAGRYDLMGWTGADRIAFALQDILAEGTARGLLEMLFGAGMVILTARLARDMTPWAALHAYYRRYAALFLLGVVHVFVLLWEGDILSVYAPAALILYGFRNRSARTMLMTGLLLGPVLMTAGLAAGHVLAPDRAPVVAAAEASLREGRPLTGPQRAALDAEQARERSAQAEARELEADMAAERAARLGPFAAYATWNREQAMHWLREGIYIFAVLEALATMLVGAALFRMGVLQGALGTGVMAAVMLGGYAIGLAIRVPATLAALEPARSGGILDAGIEVGRLAMVLGHVGLAALVARTAAGARLLAPFADVGRVALSLYIVQTLVGMWLVFPGFALGWWGRLGWADMMAFAVVVSAIQLVMARLWLRRFRSGPIEWLWRRMAGAPTAARPPDGASPPPA